MSTRHDSTAGRSEQSFGELQGQLLLKNSVGSLALDGVARVKLPTVQAPSLEGLTVAAPELAPLTGEELQERFEALCREHAPRRDREECEEVALGDDVLLDILGYANGKLIPFSVRLDWWTQVAPEPLLPGFFESLEGAKVGMSFAVALELPETYAVESLRGATAEFIVEVKAAQEVGPVDVESPEFLASLELGSTLEEVLEQVGEALASEREAAARRELEERVLDALLERTPLELNPSVIDEEIRQRWLQAEYPALVAKNFSLEEIQESWEGWRMDTGTRVDAEWRLRVALVLQAIVARDGVQPQRDEVEELFDAVAESSQVPVEELVRRLESPGSAVSERFANLVMQAAGLRHVLSKVQLSA
jgi:trigger factor